MFDFWPVYSGERFRASWASCLNNKIIITTIETENLLLNAYMANNINSWDNRNLDCNAVFADLSSSFVFFFIYSFPLKVVTNKSLAKLSELQL